MNNVILIGDSGHSKVISNIIEANDQYTVIAKLDDKYGKRLYDKAILKAPIEIVHELLEKEPDTKVIIAIGSNRIRKKIADKLSLDSDSYLSIIHPTAVISPSATIGYGIVIMPNAVINEDSKIGDHSIVNTASIIEHDCQIENYVHISPNATLTGAVRVGEGTHIGAGATIIPTKHLGKWSTIGAGAVVNKNIPSNTTAVGV